MIHKKMDPETRSKVLGLFVEAGMSVNHIVFLLNHEYRIDDVTAAIRERLRELTPSPCPPVASPPGTVDVPTYVIPALYRWVAVVAVHGDWTTVLTAGGRIVGEPLPGGADFSKIIATKLCTSSS